MIPSTLRLHRFFVVTVLSFLLTTLFARAADTPAGVMAFRVFPPAKVTLVEVQTALITASLGRGWGLKEKSDDTVVIYLKQRKNEATVTYLVSVDKVEAYCEGYRIDANGNRKEAEQPRGWLKYLQEDIAKQFAILVATQK